MKNEEIFKRKCREISLYTPNSFHLELEVMFTQHFLKPTKKYFMLSPYIEKAQYKIKNIYM